MRRSIALTVAVLVGGLLLSSCARDSGSEDGEFHVTSQVVSHEATKDLLVFAPDGEGPWPVVVAFHGIGGTGQDMAEIATRLAREGSVVFVPTYETDITTQEGVDRAAVDAECGYRFARSIAAEKSTRSGITTKRDMSASIAPPSIRREIPHEVPHSPTRERAIHGRTAIARTKTARP